MLHTFCCGSMGGEQAREREPGGMPHRSIARDYEAAVPAPEEGIAPHC
jgi:hypothetical protein